MTLIITTSIHISFATPSQNPMILTWNVEVRRGRWCKKKRRKRNMLPTRMKASNSPMFWTTRCPMVARVLEHSLPLLLIWKPIGTKLIRDAVLTTQSVVSLSPRVVQPTYVWRLFEWDKWSNMIKVGSYLWMLHASKLKDSFPHDAFGSIAVPFAQQVLFWITP